MSLTLFFLLHALHLSKCVVIWEDTLETFNNALGIGIEWTVGPNPVGSILYPPDVTEPSCPNDIYCWQFQQNYFAYYIHSTSNYDNIALTVSVSAQGLETGDTCDIYYSIDSSINWSSIASWTDADGAITFPITETIMLPSDAADNAGVGIKLQSVSSTGGNKNDYCYFWNVILEGDIINTAAPVKATTKAPTTAEPTISPTDLPTTTEPTSNPTAPTAPTTETPTESPITLPPTSNPSKAPNMSDTDEGGESNTKDDGAGAGYGLYGGIAAAVCCFIIILCIVVFIRKKTKEKESDNNRTQVERMATATYLDVYTGGGTPQPKKSEEVPSTMPDTRPLPNIPNTAQSVELKPERTEQAESALTGPAPPVELREIFGPTQKDKMDNDSESDDSLLKKQAYFQKQEK